MDTFVNAPARLAVNRPQCLPLTVAMITCVADAVRVHRLPCGAAAQRGSSWAEFLHVSNKERKKKRKKHPEKVHCTLVYRGYVS